MEMNELCRKYAGFMSRQKEFSVARSLVLRNVSGGNVWLIGGSVYQNLAHILHGSPKPKVDFDFIVELALDNSEIRLPAGWELRYNRYWNPKFVSDLFSVDYVPLNNISSIQRRELEPKIENYLTGTPLTIQSFVFDVITQEVIGEIGMKALFEKTIGINDDAQAEISASRKGKSIEEIIKEKAESLGFRAVMN